jgi:MFS family permease
MLLTMPMMGRLTERFGGGVLALAGVLVLAGSTVPLAFVGVHSSIVEISLVLLLRGVGIGLAFVPAMSVAFASMRPDQLSDATPQLNSVQRLGGALGTAVLAVVLQRDGQGSHSLVHVAHAFDSAYWWSLGIAALAVIPALVLLRAERPGPRQQLDAVGATEAGIEPLGA